MFGWSKHTFTVRTNRTDTFDSDTYVDYSDFYFDEDLDECANAYQAHNDPVDPGSDDGGEALDNGDDEEKGHVFFICCTG